MQALRVIFAGGGTGGHLFPAIAIADEIGRLSPGAEILFIGTKQKLEARVVPARGYRFRAIWISGFHRSLRPGNLLFPVKLVVSLMQATSIIRTFKPDVVVGTGGYVSGPVLRAALMQHIPTLIQEQNSMPGVTTRLLAGKVDEVHLTFENSRSYLRRQDNIHVSGNPTRRDLENVDNNQARRFFGFEETPARKIVLAFGGSLGAHSINEAVRTSLPRLLESGFNIIWQTGPADLQGMKGLESPGRVWVGAFIDRMDLAYAAADIVVCRAGATTIAELTRLGKPAILIPYPHAAANHQVDNARTLMERGAALMVEDSEAAEQLSPLVLSLLKGDRLQRMSRSSRGLGNPAAAETIARSVIDLARRGKGRET